MSLNNQQEWVRDLFFEGSLATLQWRFPHEGYARMPGYDKVLWIAEKSLTSEHYQLIVGAMDSPRIDDPDVLRDDGLVKLVSPQPVPYRGKQVLGRTIEIYACIPVSIDAEKKTTAATIWRPFD